MKDILEYDVCGTWKPYSWYYKSKNMGAYKPRTKESETWKEKEFQDKQESIEAENLIEG